MSMFTAESEVFAATEEMVVLADPNVSTSSFAEAAALAAAQPSALIFDCSTLIWVSFPAESDESFSIDLIASRLAAPGLFFPSSDSLLEINVFEFLAFLSVIFFAAFLAKAAAALILSSDSLKAVSFS
jgi:hypothetical protein